MNYNKIFNDVGFEQNVEPGSQLWLLGGIKAYSGTTGGHSSYSWKHDHKLISYGEPWPRAVISNYALRRCYYTHGPRKLQYENAGRPIDYIPELPGDQIDGSTTYNTSFGPVNVTGPDIQHFQLGPLVALSDSTGYFVKAHGSLVPAEEVAKFLIKYLMKSLAGMCLKTETNINTYFFGDRGAACIINACQQALQRNLIDYNDLVVLHSYIEKVILPYYEAPQQYLESDKPTVGVTPPVTTNVFACHQLYNGLYWTLPSMYDLCKCLPPSLLKERLWKIILRHSQYIEDLEVILPGKGVSIALVSFPEAVMKGVNGLPVSNWKNYLTEENLHFGDSDWSLWGFRAQKVAAKVLNSSILDKSSSELFEKLKFNLSNPENKGWLVNADNFYMI